MSRATRAEFSYNYFRHWQPSQSAALPSVLDSFFSPPWHEHCLEWCMISDKHTHPLLCCIAWFLHVASSSKTNRQFPSPWAHTDLASTGVVLFTPGAGSPQVIDSPIWLVLYVSTVQKSIFSNQALIVTAVCQISQKIELAKQTIRARFLQFVKAKRPTVLIECRAEWWPIPASCLT